MADLTSIDLTHGRRFERGNVDSILNTIGNSNRGISRLKKGEIPHLSYKPIDATISYESNSTSSILTYQTWEFSDSLVHTSSSINNSINNSWVFVDNGFTFVPSQYYIYDADSTLDWSSSYYINNYYKKYNSVNTDCLSSRLRRDPFIEEYYGGAKSRLKKFNDIFDENTNKNLISRMSRDYINTPIRYDDRDLLQNYEQNTDEKLYKDRVYFDGESDFRKIEYNLKIKAPFIKRVYTRMHGHAFDFEDLRLELVKAKENFKSAIEKMYK
jgi:hypothetical protein